MPSRTKPSKLDPGPVTGKVSLLTERGRRGVHALEGSDWGEEERDWGVAPAVSIHVGDAAEALAKDPPCVLANNDEEPTTAEGVEGMAADVKMDVQRDVEPPEADATLHSETCTGATAMARQPDSTPAISAPMVDAAEARSSEPFRRLRPASVTRPGERALTRPVFFVLHGPQRAESEPPYRPGGPFDPGRGSGEAAARPGRPAAHVYGGHLTR